MVESLRTWNNWSRRSCWSGAHCHRGSLMAVSTSGGVACRVSYRRMVDILNTSSTSCRHLYSSIVVCCRCYKRLTICRSATCDFFQVVCLRQSCWSYVAPSSVLSVYYEKICITPLVVVCSLHVPKNHWISAMHSNGTSKNVSGFTLAGVAQLPTSDVHFLINVF